MVNKIGQEMIKMPLFETKLTEAPHFDRVNGLDSKGDLIVRVTAKTLPSEQWKIRSEFYRRLKSTAKKADIRLHT